MLQSKSIGHLAVASGLLVEIQVKKINCNIKAVGRIRCFSQTALQFMKYRAVHFYWLGYRHSPDRKQ